ncbi:hypothetical protein RN001_001100 [Aquatica leii]|uniref:Uncharacterized protein n=1 Tax=Aquatica leii TaxID=1421715 RepID=A0AAN7PFQ0_9COLE|nr:hypothetical protein RN001_001100 [Aquatica leii]
MSDSEFESTPPELRDAAKKAANDLLPTKSRGRYEKCYEIYQNFCLAKGVKNIGSESVLIAYFSQLAETKKASTLWATYSMLRATLSIKNCIDISKHSSLIAYLKKQNIGYKPKKSRVFSRDQIDKFLKDAPQEFLPHKTALIIGISGACRTDELYQMKVSDVESLNNKISIVIPNTKTYHPRSFLITDVQWINIVTEYINLRKHVEDEKFFQQLRFGKITKQSFGHNTIAQFQENSNVFGTE